MANDQASTLNLLDALSAKSNCENCPKVFFESITNFVNQSKFQDFDFLDAIVILYNKLLKEHILCKVKHSDLIFCAIYFIDFFDFFQQFVFTFDVTIGLDFPIIVSDMHNKLDLAWRSCPNCSKLTFLD